MSNNVDFYIVSPSTMQIYSILQLKFFWSPSDSIRQYYHRNLYSGLTRSCPNLVVQYWIDTGGC